jgi:DegV family protein with EDD domain
MKLGLVTDSTSDLPPYLIEQYGLEVVPSILVLEGREYADGQGISREEFYRRLPDFKTSPTTASPSIGSFQERYERLLKAGAEQVLSIHAPAGLSGIFNAARLAAQAFDGRVTVVDSLSLSLGLGFQVLAAAEAAEAGLEAALAARASTRSRTRLLAALDTLEYVRRSGRVPALVARLGSLLRIKPLVEVADGQVKPIGAVRTAGQADASLMGSIQSMGKLGRLAILHTGAEPRARGFLDQLMREIGPSLPRDILLVNVTTVIGTHAGPGGLGFAAVAA